MPNPAAALQTLSPLVDQRTVVDGFVSTTQPAPTSFSDQLFVVVPEYSTTEAFGPCDWGAIHGTALPAQGAKVVIVFDEREVPVVVWWEGTQAEPASPSLVSSLPVSPLDGEEVYFQSSGMATEGVVWKLRYRSGSSFEHKWEFVGGTRLSAGPVGAITTKAIGYTALTGGPSVTVPLPGDYIATVVCFMQLMVVGAQNIEVAITHGGAAIAEGAFFVPTAQFSGGRFSSGDQPTFAGLSAGEVLTISVVTSGGLETSFSAGLIALTPVRVG